MRCLKSRSLRLLIVIFCLMISSQFATTTVDALDWSEALGDDGKKQFVMLDYTPSGSNAQRYLYIKYPMVSGGAYSFTASVNGSTAITFTDSVSEGAESTLNPSNKTYKLNVSNGLLKLGAQSWYQEGDRRVLRLSLEFGSPAIFRYTGISVVNGSSQKSNGTVGVSMQPGDLDDLIAGDSGGSSGGGGGDRPLTVEFEGDGELLGNDRKKITAKVYGDTSKYRWIVWKIYVDTDWDNSFSEFERLSNSSIVYSSDYMQASFVLQGHQTGIIWGAAAYPAVRVAVYLSNQKQEGALPSPDYTGEDPDPDNPDPDDPNGGSSDLSPIAVYPVDPVGQTSGDLGGIGQGYKCYVGDNLSLRFRVVSTNPYKSSFVMYGSEVKDNIVQLGSSNILTSNKISWAGTDFGGDVVFKEPGWYRLCGMFVDSKGSCASASILVRVYQRPVARLSEMGTSNGSWTHYQGDVVWISSGLSGGSVDNNKIGDPRYQLRYPVDFKKDCFTVTPMDGQSLDSVFVMNEAGNNLVTGTKSGAVVYYRNVPLNDINSAQKGYRGFGFSLPGRYKIEYTLTDGAGYQAKTEEIVYITGRALPSIQASIAPVFYRDRNGGTAVLRVSGPDSKADDLKLTVSAEQSAMIDSLRVRLVYDSDGDGVFDLSKDRVIEFTKSETKNGVTCRIEPSGSTTTKKMFRLSFSVKELGKYQIRIACKTGAPSTAFPLIPAESDMTPEMILLTEVDNRVPSATYSAFVKPRVDTVIAVGNFEEKEKLLESLDVYNNKISSDGTIDSRAIAVDTTMEEVGSDNPDAKKIFEKWYRSPDPNAFELKGSWIANICFDNFGGGGSGGLRPIKPGGWSAENGLSGSVVDSDTNSNLKDRDLEDSKSESNRGKSKSSTDPDRCVIGYESDRSDLKRGIQSYAREFLPWPGGNVSDDKKGLNQIWYVPESEGSTAASVEAILSVHNCSVGSGFVLAYDPEKDTGIFVIVTGRDGDLLNFGATTLSIIYASGVRSVIGLDIPGPDENGEYTVDLEKTIPGVGFAVDKANVTTSFVQSSYDGGTMRLKAEINNGIVTVWVQDTQLLQTDLSNWYFESGQANTVGYCGLFAGCCAGYSDVKVGYTSTRYKTLGEALNEADWRDGANRYALYFSDEIPEEAKDTNSEKYLSTVERLTNSNTYLISCGTSRSRSSLEGLGQHAYQGSSFMESTPIESALGKAAQLVIDRERSNKQSSNWFLLNDEIYWETTWDDAEKDPALNSSPSWSDANAILAERWRFTHEPTYFENNLGMLSNSGRWVQNPISVARQTGKYSINYKRRDNPISPDVNLSHRLNGYRYWSKNYDSVIGKALSAGAFNVPDLGDLASSDSSVTLEGSDSLTDSPTDSLTDAEIKISDSEVQRAKLNREMLGEFWDWIRGKIFVDAHAESWGDVGEYPSMFTISPTWGGCNITRAQNKADKLAVLNLPGGDVEFKAGETYKTFSSEELAKLTGLGKPTVSDIKFRRTDDGMITAYVDISKDPVKLYVGEFHEEGTTFAGKYYIEFDPQWRFTWYLGMMSMTSNESAISMSLESIFIGSPIEVTVTGMGYQSTEIATTVKLTDIWTGEVKDDTTTVTQGSGAYIDIGKNDKKDAYWGDLKPISAELVSGGGEFEVQAVADIPAGATFEKFTGKYVVAYRTDPNLVQKTRLKVNWAGPRMDFPSIVSYIDIDITKVDQGPVVKAITSDEVKAVASFGDDGVKIPVSLFLNKATDGDTPQSELRLSRVAFSTAGKVSIVGDKVVLSGLKGMSGLVVFYYYVTDGKYESEPGRVAVYLERARELPSAVGDTAVLNLASGEVIIDVLANDSYSGWTPVISNISDVTLDGNKCEGVRLSVDWAGSRPRIRVDSTVAEVLTSGDQIKFNYTLSTQEDGSISKLARVTVTVIGAATAGDNEGLIYVHRKPVAGFRPVLQRAGDKIVGVTMGTTDEFSYDLDHISENNKNSLKGICNWNWSIQENLSGYFETFSVQGGWGSTLSDIRLENIRAAQDRLQESIDRGMAASGVLLRLSVKDVDGAWSDPFSVLVTDKKLPPVAKFELPVSTFYIAETGSSFGSDFKVFDQSYSPSGFDIVQYTWKFTNNKGISETIITSNPESRVVELVNEIFADKHYSNDNARFKLGLTVTDSEGQESEFFSREFIAYKKNQAPVITVPDSSSIGKNGKTTLFYQIDDGKDGSKGDNLGMPGSGNKGDIVISDLVEIRDDNTDIKDLKTELLFAGQSVSKRSLFKDAGSTVDKVFEGIAVSAAQLNGGPPVVKNVTAMGLIPGAHRVQVTVTDSPNSDIWGKGSELTTVLTTSGVRQPWHLFVVPKLDVTMHYRFGDWIDGKINAVNGKSLAESGLTAEDIAPCVGDKIVLYADTSKYITGLTGFRDVNNNGKFDTGDDLQCSMKNTGITSEGLYRWEVEVELEEVFGQEQANGLTNMAFVFNAVTNWGSEDEKVVTRSKQKKLAVPALAVKLYDFRVTGVTDSLVSDKFSQWIKKSPVRDALNGVPVGDLPVEYDVSTDLSRKGFAFYFEVNSKGLSKDTDGITIKPRFYQVSRSESGDWTVGKELTAFVTDSKGKVRNLMDVGNSDLVKLYPLYYEGERTHNLNSHAEIRLPISLRSVKGNTQNWKGRFGIPSTTRFALTSVDLDKGNEYKGDVLIAFGIDAIKKGTPRFNYVERGQWLKERQTVKNSSKSVFSDAEGKWKSSKNNIGAVIVYDGSQSVEDKYIVAPVWSETDEI